MDVAGQATQLLAHVARGIAGPATLTTALLYYFGWARTQSEAAYFGLDARDFGFSVQDYVLRSVDSMFFPLVTAAIACLFCVFVHSVVVREHAPGATKALRRVLPAGCGLVGATLLAWGLDQAMLRFASPRAFLGPLAMAAGMVLLAYAVHARRVLSPAAPPRPAAPALRKLPSVEVAVLSLLVLLCLFWSTSGYADRVGTRRGRELAAHLAERPEIILYSKLRLNIADDGVTESALGDAAAAYQYRYNGLRLLIHSAGRYFLLPSQWAPSNATTIVLPDTDAPRVDFVR